MFVPYFLFLNVKFNGTVLPFEYLEILGFHIKGYLEGKYTFLVPHKNHSSY